MLIHRSSPPVCCQCMSVRSASQAACSRTADAATAEAEGEEDSDCEGETDSFSTKGSSGELKLDKGNMGAPVVRGELPTI